MRVLTAVIAIATGIIVLLGYFFPLLEPLRLMFVEWAIVIAATAVLIGIYNMVAVQLEKIRARQRGGSYGMFLIVALIVTFGFALTFGPENSYVRLLAVDTIIVPVEASLMAILAITLIYASIRLLRRRVDVMSVVFLVVAVFFLILIMPTTFGPIPFDQTLLKFMGVLSGGGARGLLIGIALGTLLTGLRVLFGVDRPYGGN